jgi:hypothetical protein
MSLKAFLPVTAWRNQENHWLAKQGRSWLSAWRALRQKKKCPGAGLPGHSKEGVHGKPANT